MVTGPAVAIDAIAHGRAAALAMDQYMQDGQVEQPCTKALSAAKRPLATFRKASFSTCHALRRSRWPSFPSGKDRSQVEVEAGFTESQAINETAGAWSAAVSPILTAISGNIATDFGVDIRPVRRRCEKAPHRRDPSIYHARPQQVHQLRPVRKDLLGNTADLGPRLRLQGVQVRGQAVHGKTAPSDRTASPAAIASAACPTGAIMEKLPFRKPGPWAFEDKESICSFCSVGCALNYRVFHNGLFTVSNADGTSHNKGYLCAKGRFGYRYMMDEKRILQDR